MEGKEKRTNQRHRDHKTDVFVSFTTMLLVYLYELVTLYSRQTSELFFLFFSFLSQNNRKHSRIAFWIKKLLFLVLYKKKRWKELGLDMAVQELNSLYNRNCYYVITLTI
jgi:hypothetical protein